MKRIGLLPVRICDYESKLKYTVGYIEVFFYVYLDIEDPSEIFYNFHWSERS
jgi:hypothetical protein